MAKVSLNLCLKLVLRNPPSLLIWPLHSDYSPHEQEPGQPHLLASCAKQVFPKVGLTFNQEIHIMVSTSEKPFLRFSIETPSVRTVLQFPKTKVDKMLYGVSPTITENFKIPQLLLLFQHFENHLALPNESDRHPIHCGEHRPVRNQLPMSEPFNGFLVDNTT